MTFFQFFGLFLCPHVSFVKCCTLWESIQERVPWFLLFVTMCVPHPTPGSTWSLKPNHQISIFMTEHQHIRLYFMTIQNFKMMYLYTARRRDILYPYTAVRRDVLGNTSPEAPEISWGRGFCTPRPERLPEGNLEGPRVVFLCTLPRAQGLYWTMWSLWIISSDINPVASEY